jgi:hypothetical protein
LPNQKIAVNEPKKEQKKTPDLRPGSFFSKLKRSYFFFFLEVFFLATFFFAFFLAIFLFLHVSGSTPEPKTPKHS